MAGFPSKALWPLLRLRDSIPVLGSNYEPKPEEHHFSYLSTDTTLNVHTMGLGDQMMVRQFGAAYCEYLSQHSDPDLGTVELVVGGYGPYIQVDPADLNLFWLYSFGPLDDRPGEYIDFLEREMNVLPDIILCSSQQIAKEAQQAGYPTIRFPIGVYGYRPLGLERSGFGYAGSEGHKDESEVNQLMGGYMSNKRFEWVDDLTSVDQLNLWYNTVEFNFGLHKKGQRQLGTVNSRVFESLASATPLILQSHPTIEDILGFEYPYQASDGSDVDRLVERIRSRPEEVRKDFNRYSDLVREKHSYLRRIEHLVEQVA